MARPISARGTAKANGDSTYTLNCPKHGETTAYVSGGCLKCRRVNVEAWQEKNPTYFIDRHKETYDPAVAREKRLMKEYNMTIADYDAMLLEQEGNCKVCSKPHSGNVNGDTNKPMFIDHCHTSGKVRGLLCHNCNTALGHIKDDVELATKLIKYLGEYV
jgi:hypothetical protein